MRVAWPIAILAPLVLAASGEAGPRRHGGPAPAIAQAQDPEPARTNQAVVLRKKPSAKAPAVGKLPANAEVVVEAEQNGWLRVRAKPSGKKKPLVGFVAKSAITLPATQPAASSNPTPGEDTPVTHEARQTTEEVVLRDKPGEKQTALATLAAGTTVTIEAERGRWMRVRAGKLVGYVARTTLTTPPTPPPVADATPTPAADAPSEPPSGTWSTARRADSSGGTQLYGEVTAAAQLRSDPRADGALVAEVAKGARILVLDASTAPGWVHVRTDGGAEGFVPIGQVGNGAAAVAVIGSADDRTTPAIGTGRSAISRERRAFAVRLDASLGYRVIGMDLTSSGGAGLANYLVSADASAAGFTADVVPLRAGKLSVAADAGVQLGRSSPGIDYTGPSQPGGKIPFSTFAVDTGVRVGTHAQHLFEVAARGGLHYDAFVADKVDNAGALPRERLFGATLGARVDVMPPRSRFEAMLHLDALVVGSRRQTPGLEDGASNVAHAVWGGATVHVRIAHHVTVLGGYDFGRITTQWSGMSVRVPGAMNSRRVDSTQVVQIGLGVDM